ncbi:MAG: hypothetical protein ABSG12_08885, partial [Steroidobacteraceae bacterium]
MSRATIVEGRGRTIDVDVIRHGDLDAVWQWLAYSRLALPSKWGLVPRLVAVLIGDRHSYSQHSITRRRRADNGIGLLWRQTAEVRKKRPLVPIGMQ